MAMRMLIDAAHPEETRVVVVDGNRLEEFDFESSTKRQLKGNIYLAKVTRVEPSLQAAFVDYGGNRDGFLPFSEIHPDYYQIPIADRQALLKQEAAEGAADQASEEAAAVAEAEAEAKADAAPGDGGDARRTGDDEAEDRDQGQENDEDDAGEPAEPVEDVGGDAFEDVVRPPVRPARPYKIQEVIKRRQILLVQVVKEERGTKGAALTTYLSLAGRYCVLMPNTARGGGISRKIISSGDRKRLKDIVESLDVPPGTGVIVRTAGLNRNKTEIKRDFDYLLRLWDGIRESTLKSTAPTLVYEEANLIKRSIRDLYNKDITEILVEGEEGYRAAKSFMRLMIPSHAKVVQPYRDDIPLLHRYNVDPQFDAMHSPTVHLKSGGYIVINPTEALVAIDVNSGRATKERNIEQTALATNLEAAEEVARQVRLRDLAGLIVIDFIDMDSPRNNRSVERRFKDHLKSDRARLQVGRISVFGLMEMSRQRLRPSLLEASSQTCQHCAGSGLVRSTESSALHVLRAVEEEGLRKQSAEIEVRVATSVALYLLNFKRSALATIEGRYEMTIYVLGDDSLVPPEMRIVRQKVRAGAVVREEDDAAEAEAEEGGRKRRRRPRRRKRREEGEGPTEEVSAEAEETAEEVTPEAETEEEAEAGPEAGSEAEPEKKRRRRGKRGGRRRSRAARAAEAGEDAVVDTGAAETAEPEEGVEAGPPEGAESEAPEAEEKPKRARRTRRPRTTRKRPSEATSSEGAPAAEAAPDVSETAPAENIPIGEAAAEKVEPVATPEDFGMAGEPVEPPSPPADIADAPEDSEADFEPQPPAPPLIPEPEGDRETEPAPPLAAAPEQEEAPSNGEKTGSEPERPSRRGWWRKSTS